MRDRGSVTEDSGEDDRFSSSAILRRKKRVLHRPIRTKLRQLRSESTQQIRGCNPPLVTQHHRQFQSVDYRLSTHIVVGENKGVGSVLLKVFDTRLPLQQFLARVQVIVRGR